MGPEYLYVMCTRIYFRESLCLLGKVESEKYYHCAVPLYHSGWLVKLNSKQ